MADKEIRADAKLKNLHAEALEDLWRFRNPEEGGEKLTLEAIAVEVPLRYGFTVSLSTLSEFYAWLRVERRLSSRAALADQLKLELAKDPDLTEDQIQRAGQRLFIAESIIEKDARVFADLVKIGQNERRLAQNDEKIGLDKRKLAMLEKKAAFYDAVKEKAKDAGTGGVTAEQMEDIERRLKMM